MIDAVAVAYQSAANRLGNITLEDFRIAVSRCDVHPVKVHGKLAGAILVSGPEVHACILPWAHKRWFGRQQARILNDIISKHGYATTSATTEAGRKFVERLGFVKTTQGYIKEVPYGH